VKKIFITIYVLLLLLPLKAQQPFNVQAAALWALSQSDPAEALTLAKSYEKDSKGALCDAIFIVYTTSGGDPEWPYVYQTFLHKSLQEQFDFCERFGDMVTHVRNPMYAQQGITALKDLQLKYRFDTEEKITAVLDHIRNIGLIPHNQ
jgi:aminopeptidase N